MDSFIIVFRCLFKIQINNILFFLVLDQLNLKIKAFDFKIKDVLVMEGEKAIFAIKN